MSERLVGQIQDICDNIFYLVGALSCSNRASQKMATDLLRGARNYAAMEVSSGTFWFGPSRFIGYRHNTLGNWLLSFDKDGKETTNAVTSLLGEEAPAESPELQKHFESFLGRLGIAPARKVGAKKFWKATLDMSDVYLFNYMPRQRAVDGSVHWGLFRRGQNLIKSSFQRHGWREMEFDVAVDVRIAVRTKGEGSHVVIVFKEWGDPSAIYEGIGQLESYASLAFPRSAQLLRKILIIPEICGVGARTIGDINARGIKLVRYSMCGMKGISAPMLDTALR